jgi:hypothetical protein
MLALLFGLTPGAGGRAAALVVLGLIAGVARAKSPAGWESLSAAESFADWQCHEGWSIAGDVTADSQRPEGLKTTRGQGVLVSLGEGVNLKSRDEFQDVEVRLEFMIPRGSNSGVKLAGLYEIQILDSHGVKELTGDMSGGVYPRAEQEPDYHHIDGGIPPRVNAAKPAGEWQTLEIGFVAPRFDAAGKKTSNARFTRVVLNGEVIHENVELAWPTGAAWRLLKETPRGPLLLQGDHGLVAFRKIQVRRTDRLSNARPAGR